MVRYRALRPSEDRAYCPAAVASTVARAGGYPATELITPYRAAASPSDSVLPARLWEGAAVAAVVAVGWLLLALNQPTTTYHFAPLVLVIAPVALMRMRVNRSLPWRSVLTGTGIGAVLALVAAGILFASHALRGPGLVADIGPVAEIFIAIILGMAIEIASTAVRRVFVTK